MTNNTISLELLATVTGGCTFEDGGVAGPIGSPTPKPSKPIFEDGGVVGPIGSPTHRPIPESGGVAGPIGSPTPF